MASSAYWLILLCSVVQGIFIPSMWLSFPIALPSVSAMMMYSKGDKGHPRLTPLSRFIGSDIHPLFKTTQFSPSYSTSIHHLSDGPKFCFLSVFCILFDRGQVLFSWFRLIRMRLCFRSLLLCTRSRSLKIFS